MPTHTLTELQYSKDRQGPFALYIYEPNSEFHRGKRWFENKPKYPDEEITTATAHACVNEAIQAGREVRVTDGGDMLVYHWKGGKVLYGETFWEDLANQS